MMKPHLVDGWSRIHLNHDRIIPERVVRAAVLTCKSQLSLTSPHAADEPLTAPYRPLSEGLHVCENL
jgi:hypothetical protein